MKHPKAPGKILREIRKYWKLWDVMSDLYLLLIEKLISLWRGLLAVDIGSPCEGKKVC